MFAQQHAEQRGGKAAIRTWPLLDTRLISSRRLIEMWASFRSKLTYIGEIAWPVVVGKGQSIPAVTQPPLFSRGETRWN